MNRRKLIGLATGALISVSGCTSDAENTEPVDPENFDAEIPGMSVKVDGFGKNIIMDVELDFPESNAEPLLEVTDGDGETIYSENQVNSKPAEVELGSTVIQKGGSYDLTLSVDGTEVASHSVSYSGPAVELESFDLTTDKPHGTHYFVESTLELSNSGDLPLAFDDFVVKFGSTELNDTYDSSGGIISPGQTKSYESTHSESKRPAEYDVTIDLYLDGTNVAELTTTVQLS